LIDSFEDADHFIDPWEFGFLHRSLSLSTGTKGICCAAILAQRCGKWKWVAGTLQEQGRREIPPLRSG
jgi:hypothetical protein